MRGRISTSPPGIVKAVWCVPERSRQEYQSNEERARWDIENILKNSAVMYGGFQGGPQLGPHDAERRQSLGQL